jgi:hypothetical protein
VLLNVGLDKLDESFSFLEYSIVYFGHTTFIRRCTLYVLRYVILTDIDSSRGGASCIVALLPRSKLFVG